MKLNKKEFELEKLIKFKKLKEYTIEFRVSPSHMVVQALSNHHALQLASSRLIEQGINDVIELKIIKGVEDL